jgi:seryl-tRNA synthetase
MGRLIAKGKNSVPTQEERLTALEKTFATFRKETAARTQEIEENTTIMLGVMRSQGQDIRRIFESLEPIESKLGSLETKLDEHTSLLTQILERLPN